MEALLVAVGILLCIPAIAAASTGSIAGKVTNAVGHAAIEGVEVCVLNASTQDNEGCESTDATGDYTIGSLPSGSYKVEFSIYGSLNYITQYYNGKSSFGAADTVSVAGGSTTANVNAEMHAGGQIKGTVIDANSKGAVEGVEVCAEEIGGAEEFQCAETEANGEYAISRLPTGSYKVEFYSYSLNYITQYYDGKSSFEAADPVSVTAGSITPNINAEMHEGGKIKGKVIDAVSKSPLGEIDVCAYGSGEEEYPTRCSYTDSEGEYTLSNLATGSYKIKFTPEYSDHTHVSQYYDGKSSLSGADAVAVTAGSVTPGINAELLEGGKITGTVTKASGGGGIESIQVCAIPTNFESGSYGCGSTNASGQYTISGLSEGGYKVEFNGGLNYITQYYNGKSSEEEGATLAVSDATTTSSINAELAAAGQIKGKVVDASSKAALNNIEICAIKVGNSYPQTNGCTSFTSNGEYTLGGLPAGSYKVRFAAGYGEISPGVYGHLNYLTQFYNGKSFEGEAEAVSVSVGTATPNVNAEMHEGGKIAGTVIDASSKAGVQSVDVCASATSRRGSSGNCAETNGEGKYTISGLATGSYKVKFQPGYEDRNDLVQYYNGEPTKREADPVSVTAGSTTPNINAELHAGGEITGTVIDAVSKAPIEDIEVCPSGGHGSCATTNSAGKYMIQGLPTATYKVEFLPGYESTNRNYLTQYYNGKTSREAGDEVSVTAGSTTPNVNAEMHEGGKIAGTVIDASSKAGVQYVEACAYKAGSGENERCDETNASGQYTIEGLPTGSYKVGFFLDAYEGPEGESPNANYLTQYYNAKPSQEAADPVSVTAGSTTPNINAEMHEGGKIAGTVIDASSKAGVRFAEVCAYEAGSGEYVRCGYTNASGQYTIEGLPTGSYKVSFWPGVPGFESPQNNYLFQYYSGKSSEAEADPVSVTAGSTTPNINAEMHPGGQIKGKVTAASDHAPLQSVEVCALEAGGEEEVDRCASTNSSGEYTIVGLATGSYKVEFSALNYEYEEGFYYEEELTPEEEFTTQFYNGKPSLSLATPISVTVGVAVTGINASMVEPAAAATKPVNTEAPLLSGTPAVGEVLSCSPGLWSGSPTGYSYRWLRGGVEISGKTAATYTVQSADQSHAISCKVTASNSKGSTSAVSNEVQVPAEGAGETQHSLVVSLAGDGSGTVTSSPSGISCSPTCSHAFAAGTSVVLTAAPAAGSSFAGWSGACSGTGACHVTLNSDASATATFSAGGGGGGGGGGSPGGGGGSPGGGAATSGGALPPPAPSPKLKELKCRKGFKRKVAKGKAKCVKVKKHGKKGK